NRLAEVERGLLTLWVAAFGSIDQGPDEYWRAVRYADAAVRVLVESMDPALVDRTHLDTALDLAYELGVADAAETNPDLATRIPRRHRGPLDLGTVVDEQTGRAAIQLTGDAILDQQF